MRRQDWVEEGAIPQWNCIGGPSTYHKGSPGAGMSIQLSQSKAKSGASVPKPKPAIGTGQDPGREHVSWLGQFPVAGGNLQRGLQL